MARRMTESSKWEDPSFRALSPELKAVYFWLYETWPHTGVRTLDLGLCSFQVGMTVTIEDVLKTGVKLYANGDLYFFPAFILMNQGIDQFNRLNESNRAHNAILKAIFANGLNELCEELDNGEEPKEQGAWKPLRSPLEGASKGLARGYSISKSISTSTSIGKSHKDEESKYRFTRENATGGTDGTGAGNGRETGEGGAQGVQDGTDAHGQHSQGAKGHEDNPAEGREDRRTSPAIVGDKPEQKAQEARGGQHGLPAPSREGSLQPARQEAEVTQETETAESGLTAVFCSYPSKTTTEPMKNPTAASTGRKKLVPVGKSAMETEHPEVYALWQAAPPMSRQRSSTREVLAAWLDVRKHGAPSQEELLESIEAWKRSKKWAENGGEYIEGLHRWVKNRQWENTPLSSMQIATEQAKEADRELMEYMNRGY